MKFARSLAAALMLALAPVCASAGQLDVSGDLSGFTSPGNVYGPWRYGTISYRDRLGKDSPGLTLVDRSDADRLNPTHSLAATLDDYHDWSKKFFTYAAVSASAGNVLPTRSLYLEGDVKLGKALTTVIGLGAGVVVNPDGVVQRYINVGPSVYYGNSNLTLRWLPTFTNGRSGTSSAILSFQNGQQGHFVTTANLIVGSQPPGGIAALNTPLNFGQRALAGDVAIRKWTSSRGGFTLGVGAERLSDRTTGNLIYARRSIDVGIFRITGPIAP